MDFLLPSLVGESASTLIYARCNYSVSSLGAASAAFKQNGICVLTTDGIAFMSYDKMSGDRTFDFKVARNDIKLASLWAKNLLRQIQLTTPIAQVVFDVNPDGGSLGDPRMGDAFWNTLKTQNYPTSLAGRGVFDEGGVPKTMAVTVK